LHEFVAKEGGLYSRAVSNNPRQVADFSRGFRFVSVPARLFAALFDPRLPRAELKMAAGRWRAKSIEAQAKLSGNERGGRSGR
jgi:hypothetical protein